MLIGFRPKWVFIHVPKTAGSSLANALTPWSYRMSLPARVGFKVLRRLGLKSDPCTWNTKCWLTRRRTKHVTAAQLKGEMPPGWFERSFKFAFVRNPWDWLVSWYEYGQTATRSPKYELIKYLKTFPRYVEWHVEHYRLTQHEFITDAGGGLLVDYVGRFEQLPESVRVIGQRLGLRIVLPHVNRSERRAGRDYRSYYDDRLRERVADFFRRDIEMFGYDFEPAAHRALRLAA